MIGGKPNFTEQSFNVSKLKTILFMVLIRFKDIYKFVTQTIFKTLISYLKGVVLGDLESYNLRLEFYSVGIEKPISTLARKTSRLQDARFTKTLKLTWTMAVNIHNSNWIIKTSQLKFNN